MEHVIVVYPHDRPVYVDGHERGRTNKTIMLGTPGRYTFHLGDPRDYKPKWRRPLVKDTSPICPQEVIFEEL